MTTSKVISKEHMTAYERWELPNVSEGGQGDCAVPGPGCSSEEIDDPEEVAELITAERLEEIQRQAYEEGFELGQKEGYQHGQKEVLAEAQRMRQILGSLAEPLKDVDEEVERELVALALEVARQLIRRELRTEPGQVVAVVRDALSALPADSLKVQVFLHPDDATLVRNSLSLGEGEEQPWRIVDDPVLTRGGARIVTENSRIDATVEKRLAAVVARLMGGERQDDRTEG